MSWFTRYFTRSTRLALIVGMTAAPIWMANDSLGQVFDGGMVGPAMVMPSTEKIVGAKHYQLQHVFAIEIRRIDSVAKLDDAQKTKLNVGVKGLTKKLSQDFARSFESMMGPGMMADVSGEVVVAGPQKNNKPKGKDIQIEEVKKFEDIDPNVMMMLENPMSAKPTEDPNWLKLVKSVLTPDQFGKFEQLCSADKGKSDKAMVDAGVAAMSLELLLNKDQEAKIGALVLTQVNKPKEKSSSSVQFGMMLPEGMAFYSHLANIDSKLLKEVLDREQFELTEIKLSQTRQMMQSLGGAFGDTQVLDK